MIMGEIKVVGLVSLNLDINVKKMEQFVDSNNKNLYQYQELFVVMPKKKDNNSVIMVTI